MDVRIRKWELCCLSILGWLWPSCGSCPVLLLSAGTSWGRDWSVWPWVFLFVCFVFNCSSSKNADSNEKSSNDEGVWSWGWPHTHCAQTCETFMLPGGENIFPHAIWSNGSFSDCFLPTDEEGDRHQCGETGEGPSAGTPDVEHVQHVLTRLMLQFVVWLVLMFSPGELHAAWVQQHLHHQLACPERSNGWHHLAGRAEHTHIHTTFKNKLV